MVKIAFLAARDVRLLRYFMSLVPALMLAFLLGPYSEQLHIKSELIHHLEDAKN
jgi:hypothetical protein